MEVSLGGVGEGINMVETHCTKLSKANKIAKRIK